MSKVFSGFLAEYYLALPACDGPLARFAIELHPMGLQWWAAQTSWGLYAKAVLAWNERVRRCDAGGCRAGGGHAREGATGAGASHVQLDWLLHWRPHRRRLGRRKRPRP